MTSDEKRADRVAQEGWLSAIVCLGATGQLRLGQSGVAMQPRLEAGHVVELEAGLLPGRRVVPVLDAALSFAFPVEP